MVEDFKLTGDIDSLKYAFLSARRKVVGTPVPESILHKLQAFPGGISGFYEDAVASYNGDLEALVLGAVQFIEHRKRVSPHDPIQPANGRISQSTFMKIERITQALTPVRGLSRAKVISGLIQLNLRKLNK